VTEPEPTDEVYATRAEDLEAIVQGVKEGLMDGE
jgi:hypothetical protein